MELCPIRGVQFRERLSNKASKKKEPAPSAKAPGIPFINLSALAAVVLVFVNLLGDFVLLGVEGLAILRGQLAVVHLAHVALFLI